MQAQAAEERIKKNTHASLVQQFVEIMQHYQSVQAKYKQQYQDNVRRQILVGTSVQCLSVCLFFVLIGRGFFFFFFL